MAKFVFKTTEIEVSRKVVDEGVYWLTFNGFAPKMSQKGDSINFYPQLDITSMEDGSPAPTKDDGRPISLMFNCNEKAKWIINDMVHAFGIPLEEDGQGNSMIPGVWVPEGEQDITKCEYKGPLIGKKGKVHLIKGDFNGTPQNKIKSFFCAVPNCQQKYPKIKHSDDLNRKK
jgi:hypothetical protein